LNARVPQSSSERLWPHFIHPLAVLLTAGHGAGALDIVRLNRSPWPSIGTISTAGKAIFGELAAARAR
jgi:hypothetical protein